MWIKRLGRLVRLIHIVDPINDPLRDPIEIKKRSPDRYSPCPVCAERLFTLTEVGKILTVVWLF